MLPPMKNKLRIMFIPFAAVGHVNAAVGMAQVLMNSGHEVVFYISDQWKNKFAKYGIKELLYEEPIKEYVSDKDPAAVWAELCKMIGIFNGSSPLQKMKNMYGDNYQKFIGLHIKFDKMIEKVLPLIKPDVIMCDQLISLPSVELSGIPWVLVCSCNPLTYIEDERTPPYGSGM
jgi:UDP:flavonoid glycosyltransferase YjiC (YdhE family)